MSLASHVGAVRGTSCHLAEFVVPVPALCAAPAPVAVYHSRYLPCPFRITCRVRGASISSVRGASANGGVHRASACRVSGDGASTLSLSLSQAPVVEQDTLRRSPL